MDELKFIIGQCLLHDRKYQKILYERYYGFAFKVVFRYIYRYDKIPDVVNDGFVKLFSKLGTFVWNSDTDLEKLLMGWIRRIMVNTAIDELRKSNLIPEIGGMPEDIWAVDNSQSSDASLLYKELVLQVKRLPPAYRAVFNMYVIDGFSHQEIANRLGINVGTSKSNLFKARAFLQKILIRDNKVAEICNS